MGLDKRIGPAFLDAGLGWGGSCFPKDVQALVNMAANDGCHPQLLRAVMEINHDQRRQVVIKLQQTPGQPARAGRSASWAWPSSPTPTTCATRPRSTSSPAAGEGATVKAYDPVAMDAARRLLPDVDLLRRRLRGGRGLRRLVVVTEWNEFKQLDMAAVQRADAPAGAGRRPQHLRPGEMRELGFVYRGIGRGYNGVETGVALGSSRPRLVG